VLIMGSPVQVGEGEQKKAFRYNLEAFSFLSQESDKC